MKVKTTVRIEESLIKDIKFIAAQQATSDTQIMETALKLYRDYYHMQEKASVINQDIINVTRSMLNMAERNINNKTAKVLSELAVQNAITNMILAKSLDISEKELTRYRLAALDFLKEHQRALRLDEVITDA